MSNNDFSDRSNLKFPEEVEAQFSFLKELGFRVLETGATFVRLESTRIGVNIFHGRRSFEIGLEVTSLAKPAETFYFSTLLALCSKKDSDEYKPYATHTREGVAEGVRLLANQFRSCVARGILEDKDIFTKLRDEQEKQTDAYWAEFKLGASRGRAQDAWYRKDFRALMQELELHIDKLTLSEVKMLKYAKRQIKE